MLVVLIVKPIRSLVFFVCRHAVCHEQFPYDPSKRVQYYTKLTYCVVFDLHGKIRVDAPQSLKLCSLRSKLLKFAAGSDIPRQLIKCRRYSTYTRLPPLINQNTICIYVYILL